MDETMQHQFLEFSASKLQELAGRIETCLGMLDAGQIWARGGKNENAIGNLLLHLCGNVRQWILSGLGGAADVRERDAEFAALGGTSPAELSAKLRTTVDEAADAIRLLTAEQLARRTVIQGYDCSGLEVVYHVVEHFAMHAGQVVFAAKMLTGADMGFYRHLQGSGSQQSQSA